MISHQPDSDKIYLYTKDPYKTKYQQNNKRKSLHLNHCNDHKAFIEYSDDMNGIYENVDEYNPNKKPQNIDCS